MRISAPSPSTDRIPEHLQARPSAGRTAPQRESLAKAHEQVSLREFPYPYKAALAICSDIDDVKDTSEFMEIHRFLNTKRATSLGKGLGLEIGNSFYFYDDNHHFSYFTNDARAKRVIIDLIHAGYIDCLHSYGDAATSRDQILRALHVLYQADCLLQVWVNHNGAPSNLSRKFEYDFYRSRCEGDSPGSQVFHADVTLGYGIRFAWVGALTRVIGQSPQRPSSFLTTVLDPKHPLASTINMAKEWRKDLLGSRGDRRFTLHRKNQLIDVMELENGQKVHEFIRYCHHSRGIPFAGTCHGLAQNILPSVLEKLKAARGYSIIYTHLGQRNGCDRLIPEETRAALRGLEQEFRRGQIYLTTTSKLLNYHHNRRHLIWSHEIIDGQTSIRIDHLEDPAFGRLLTTEKQLQGITFYVPDKNRADVYIQGTRLTRLQRNLADDLGRESVTIPLIPLEFPF